MAGYQLGQDTAKNERSKAVTVDSNGNTGDGMGNQIPHPIFQLVNGGLQAGGEYPTKLYESPGYTTGGGVTPIHSRNFDVGTSFDDATKWYIYLVVSGSRIKLYNNTPYDREVTIFYFGRNP